MDTANCLYLNHRLEFCKLNMFQGYWLVIIYNCLSESKGSTVYICKKLAV